MLSNHRMSAQGELSLRRSSAIASFRHGSPERFPLRGALVGTPCRLVQAKGQDLSHTAHPSSLPSITKGRTSDLPFTVSQKQETDRRGLCRRPSSASTQAAVGFGAGSLISMSSMNSPATWGRNGAYLEKSCECSTR